MDGANAGVLWRHPNFARLWSATTVSVFGDQFTRLALPLVAVENLNASASEMGLLTTAQSLPILLFGLLAGVWVDRGSKKLILIISDTARGLLNWSSARSFSTGTASSRRAARSRRSPVPVSPVWSSSGYPRHRRLSATASRSS